VDIVGLVIGVLGLIGTVIFGRRSKRVEDAFARYVALEREIARLDQSSRDYQKKTAELEIIKENLYRHKYTPKSKAFAPGNRVRLIRTLKNRPWISEHAKPGITGVVVDYGPDTYEFLVYWSEADYEGEPIGDQGYRRQAFCVNKEDIERIT